MHIDISPLVNVAIGVLCATITAAAPFVVPLLTRWLHLHISGQRAALINAVAANGAQLVVAALKAHSTGPYDVATVNRTLALGVDHVLASVPHVVEAAGLDDAAVERIVRAKLQAALTADPDPAVTIAPAAAKPAA